MSYLDRFNRPGGTDRSFVRPDGYGNYGYDMPTKWRQWGNAGNWTGVANTGPMGPGSFGEYAGQSGMVNNPNVYFGGAPTFAGSEAWNNPGGWSYQDQRDKSRELYGNSIYGQPSQPVNYPPRQPPDNRMVADVVGNMFAQPSQANQLMQPPIKQPPMPAPGPAMVNPGGVAQTGQPQTGQPQVPDWQAAGYGSALEQWRAQNPVNMPGGGIGWGGYPGGVQPGSQPAPRQGGGRQIPGAQQASNWPPQKSFTSFR